MQTCTQLVDIKEKIFLRYKKINSKLKKIINKNSTFLRKFYNQYQTLFHPCLPFPKKLGHIMHFCKLDSIILMDKYLNFFWILFLCCQILACFKKLMAKTNTLKTFFQTHNVTTNHKFYCYFHCIKFFPFIFDISIDFFLNPYSFNNAKTCLVVSLALKNLLWYALVIN